MSGTKKSSVAILGMSPGNSFFKENTIRWLIEKVQWKFEWFRIMIPDHPAEYTYRAKWEKFPERKSRLKWNAIRNKIKAVIGQEKQSRLTLNWKEEINQHPAYRRELREVLMLYKKNRTFREAVQWATKEVLQWWDIAMDVTEKQIATGVKFLICELAFLSVAKEILGSDVTYVYHRPWPIFSDFIAWKFDGKKREICFEIIGPKD